jgi:hypothetical protein
MSSLHQTQTTKPRPRFSPRVTIDPDLETAALFAALARFVDCPVRDDSLPGVWSDHSAVQSILIAESGSFAIFAAISVPEIIMRLGLIEIARIKAKAVTVVPYGRRN